MLKNGVRCIANEREEESEASDWPGFEHWIENDVISYLPVAKASALFPIIPQIVLGIAYQSQHAIVLVTVAPVT